MFQAQTVQNYCNVPVPDNVPNKWASESMHIFGESWDWAHKGTWPTRGPAAGDIELYDYNLDYDETVNQAANPKYADTVARLVAVLRAQYVTSN